MAEPEWLPVGTKAGAPIGFALKSTAQQVVTGIEVEAMATELQGCIDAFVRVWDLPVPDSWVPAQEAQAEEICFDLLASLIVTREVAAFMLRVVTLQPLDGGSPMVEDLTKKVGLGVNDPRLHRHLVSKVKAELGRIRSAVRQLTVMHEGAGVRVG